MRVRLPSVFALLSVLGFLNAAAHAQDVVAVLSSDSGAYQEALGGLKEVYLLPIQVISLSHEDYTPHAGTIVVAFGGKAALLVTSLYKGPVIYGLAPGIEISSELHSAPLVNVRTSPDSSVVVQKFKEIQPALRRLAILWMSDSMAATLSHKNELASSLHVELVSVRLQTLDELPSQLRKLKGHVDAVWMPSDPALVTPESFAAVREFCLAEHMAFYVPSDALVAKGATAAVYASFHDLGRQTASLVNQAMAGHLQTTSLFPEKTSSAINVVAANRIGLKIDPEVIRHADKVTQ